MSRKNELYSVERYIWASDYFVFVFVNWKFNRSPFWTFIVTRFPYWICCSRYLPSTLAKAVLVLATRICARLQQEFDATTKIWQTFSKDCPHLLVPIGPWKGKVLPSYFIRPDLESTVASVSKHKIDKIRNLHLCGNRITRIRVRESKTLLV